MATADWNPLGDVYYRKTEIYSMEWINEPHIDLTKCKIAVAQFAGPIAIIRDDSKMGKVPATKPILYVYNAAGLQISHMRWSSGNLLQIGWTCSEDLLCIQDDGVILIYDMFCNFKKTFGMGEEAKGVKVKDCRIFQNVHGTGVAILTNSHRIFLVSNVEDPRIRRFAEIPGYQPSITSWATVNIDRQTKVLIANGTELALLDNGGQTTNLPFPPLNWQAGAVNDMVVCAEKNAVAFYTATGLIWVGSLPDMTPLWEIDIKCTQQPTCFVWCGTEALVLNWDTRLLIVGPDKDVISNVLDTPVHLVEEIDGVRIISNLVHEFLEKVPEVTQNVYKILSMHPGAMLRQASKEYQRGSQNADEHLRMIDRKDEAVDQCIRAAGHQLESSEQKELLRAAAFGKSFLTDYSAKEFMTMCQKLRVLNQIRHFRIGIPLTYTQMETLTIEVVIDRLVLRKHFFLAIRICQFLHIHDTEGVSRILAHWACYKMKKSKPKYGQTEEHNFVPMDSVQPQPVQQKHENDEALAYAISQKLGDTPGVSYSEIASKAVDCGREELAIRLLEYEPKASEQVPLLMKMTRNELALLKAIDSGDTDLIYTVLLKLQDSNSTDLHRQIRNRPMAYYLYLQYCRQQDRKKMQNIFYSEDNYLEQGTCHVIDSYSYERLEDRFSALKDALLSYNKSRHDFVIKQTEDQIKLLEQQVKLEEEFNRPYIDLTLHQTIYKLIVDDKTKQAESLRKMFKVPDKRFWCLKINALAESGQWGELDKFSKTKKPPIGMEYFVEVCVKHGNLFEAKKYLPRVQPEKRVQCLLKTGQLKEAADIAFENRNEDELNSVLSRCGLSEPAITEKIKNYKAQLTSKK